MKEVKRLDVDGNVKIKNMAYKTKLKKISGELKKASKLHAGQANKIDTMLKMKKSPAKGYASDAQRKAVHASKADGGKGNPNKMKKSPALAKLSASCKAAARKKFKVYPSAYANMWASKTQKAGKC